MREIDFVFSADIHADTRGFNDQVPAEDLFIAFAWLVDLANQNDTDLVLGGDVFNKNMPRPWVKNRIAAEISRLKNGCYFIQGNHDKHQEAALLDILVDLDIPVNVQRLSSTPMQIGSQQVVGVDYGNAQMFTDAVQAMNDAGVDADCLVCHQALRQGLGFEDAWNSDLNDPIFKTWKDVWIGDLHAPKEHWDKKHNTRAVYPGCLWPQNVDEAANTLGAVLVKADTDKDGHHLYQHVPGPQRPVIKIAVSSDEELDQFLSDENFIESLHPGTYAEQPESMRYPVLHVTYYKDILGVANAFREIQEAIGGGILIENGLPARGSFAHELDAQVKTTDEALTLKQIIAKKASKHQKVRDFAIELSQARSMEEVRMVVDGWRTKELKEVA